MLAAGGTLLLIFSGIFLTALVGAFLGDAARYFRGELIEATALKNRVRESLLSTGEDIVMVRVPETQVAFGETVVWLEGTVEPTSACVVLIDPMTESKRLVPGAALDSFIWPSAFEAIGMLLAVGALVSSLVVQGDGLRRVFVDRRLTYQGSLSAISPDGGAQQGARSIARLAVTVDFMVSLVLSLATVTLWFGCCWLLVVSLSFHDSPDAMKRGFQVMALLIISHVSLPLLAAFIQRKIRTHAVLKPLVEVVRHSVLLVVVLGALYNLSRSAFADGGWKEAGSLMRALAELGKALIGS